MSEERMKILEMLAEGKVSPEEANDLLGTLEKGKPATRPQRNRILKVRISQGE